uniref:Uncharacterized protein n=1 Tax=Steinernema glaseri TaxID=37863 RepID=A0A1I7Z491_9BILA
MFFQINAINFVEMEAIPFLLLWIVMYAYSFEEHYDVAWQYPMLALQNSYAPVFERPSASTYAISIHGLWMYTPHQKSENFNVQNPDLIRKMNLDWRNLLGQGPSIYDDNQEGYFNAALYAHGCAWDLIEKFQNIAMDYPMIDLIDLIKEMDDQVGYPLNINWKCVRKYGVSYIVEMRLCLDPSQLIPIACYNADTGGCPISGPVYLA